VKPLFIVTATFEAIVGLGLLIMPALTASILLSTTLETAAGLFMARLAGAAIFSIAICCWQARSVTHDGGVTAIVTGLTFYNFAAAAVLVYGGMRLGLQGPLVWPAIVAHSVLGLWCASLVWIVARGYKADSDREPL
jgi:hypothetical protein